MNPSNTTDIVRTFQSFHEDWMLRQTHHLDELLSAAESDSDRLSDLTGRVLSHYHHYFDEKSRLVGHRNALLLLSAPWLTRLERAFLWQGGFNPRFAVRLAAASAGDDLTGEQRRQMETLMVRTRVGEKALNDEVARIHESVAAPPLFGALRWRMSPSDESPEEGEEGEEEGAVELMKGALEAVVASADLLRTRTAVAVMEILTAAQGVKFLAAAGRFQLQLHSNGLQRDSRSGALNE